MARNVEQHRAFAAGSEQFEAYCTCEAEVCDEVRVRVVALIEGTVESLVRHLWDEVETLRALEKYESVRLREAYWRLEKALMVTGNNARLWAAETVWISVH